MNHMIQYSLIQIRLLTDAVSRYCTGRSEVGMTLNDIVTTEDRKVSSQERSLHSTTGSIYGLAALAAAYAGTAANGDMILQYPVNIGGGNAVIDLELVNNVEGAVFDSAILSLFEPLAISLWNSVPVNQSIYSNIEEMVGAWNVNIESSGQVYQGWNRDVNADGSIDLTNLGEIGGIPDEDYTVWRDSIQYPNQNTMALTVQIPLSQLELDGEPGYDPATDARIELGTTELPGAFVGHQAGGFPSISGTGLNYEVIPEPGTAALLGLGLLAAAYGKKLMHAKEAVTKYVSGRKD